jgi:hypothetical protein
VDFSALLKQTKAAARAPRVISLGLGAWSDARADKPREPVSIGIRLLSEQDTQVVRSEAAKMAVELTPTGTEDERVEAFNSALMCFAAEHGTCSPTDAEQPYFPMGALEIRERMTPEGVRRLWHEIEALHLASNPSLDEIDDEGLAHLFALLHRDAVSLLPKTDAARIRRLLELVRSELAETES